MKNEPQQNTEALDGHKWMQSNSVNWNQLYDLTQRQQTTSQSHLYLKLPHDTLQYSF